MSTAAPMEVERKPESKVSKGASSNPSSSAVAAPPTPASLPQKHESDEQTKPGCAKCGSLEDWGRASWCPKCGYYPKLGTWTESNPHAEVDPPPPKFILLMVPRWAWIMVAGIAGTIVFSIVGRLLTHDGEWDRTIWAMCQFMAGFICFFGVHMWIFIAATIRDSRFGTFDFFMKPFAAWMQTIHALPKTRVKVWMGAWSLSTAITALAIVGGIRYSAMFDDWGFKAPKKKDDVAAAVVKKSREGKEKGSLEDGVNELASKVKIDEKKEPTKLMNAECVVVGYVEDEEEGGFKELVLASMVDGKLQFVGTVENGFPPEVREELNRRLPKLACERPFVKCRLLAHWVQPTIMCGVGFRNWNETKMLSSPVFGKLLPDAR